MSQIVYKIKTICPEISKVIQEKLFSLGYKWGDGDKIPSCLDKKELHLWSDKKITWGDETDKCEFLSLSELMSWTNERIVKLNDACEAHIKEDGIRVNHHTENAWIPLDRLATLAEALKEAKKGIDDEPCSLDVICPEISEVVQKELFKRGCKWEFRGKSVSYTHERILAIHYRDKNTITWGDDPGLERLSLEEFFSQSKKEVSVTLTDSWTAVVTKDQVKVGCQTFDIERVEELISICRELGKI